MFKATVVASKLREKMAQYFEMTTGNDVLQILHRGNDIKVLMTQEHYLNLLSRLALYEKQVSEAVVASKSAKEIENNILAKLQQREEDELADDRSKVGKVRAR